MDKMYEKFEEFGADVALIAGADKVAEALSAYDGKKRLLETARARKSIRLEDYEAETADARDEVRERLNQLKTKIRRLDV